MAGKITDFGEHIPGARKDYIANLLNIDLDSMKGMAPNEAAKLLKLNIVFPEPDYHSLVETGISKENAIAVKVIRDEVANVFRKRSYSLDYRIDGAKKLRDLAQLIVANDFDFFNEGLERAGSSLKRKFEKDVQYYMAMGFPDQPKVASSYSIHSSYVGTSKDVKFYAVKGRSIIGDSFESYQEAADALKQRLEKDSGSKKKKQVKFDIYKYKSEEDWTIGKKVGSGKYLDLVKGIKSDRYGTQVKEYIEANRSTLEAILEKKKHIENHRRDENRERVGVDFRQGKDVTPDDYMEKFGFKGVQFGESTSNRKRQSDLNDTYDAFHDLAKVLNISTQSLSLNGSLSMAFGARGTRGPTGSIRKAHYETGYEIINLTAKNGAGSLAHEWFHALDNHISRIRGLEHGFITESPTPRKTRTFGTTQDVETLDKELLSAFQSVMDNLADTDLKHRSTQLDMRRSKDYWSTSVEMSARAFESYVIHKLSNQSASNDYLANIKTIDMFECPEDYPYLTKDEVLAIAPKFDNLLQVIKDKVEGFEPANSELLSENTGRSEYESEQFDMFSAENRLRVN